VNPKKDLLGFVVQSSLYFENLLEVTTFKHSIHGGCQYKVGFLKKNLQLC
jgi:hypothetical protein